MQEGPVSSVAISTDSASDLPPQVAAAKGIRVVPLIVNLGSQEFLSGVTLTTEQFWKRMLAPYAPFPTTAAASPGDFKEAFEAAFVDGAASIVCITVGGTLSGALKSAEIAKDLLPDREIHLVDTHTASMGEGLLALLELLTAKPLERAALAHTTNADEEESEAGLPGPLRTGSVHGADHACGAVRRPAPRPRLRRRRGPLQVLSARHGRRTVPSERYGKVPHRLRDGDDRPVVQGG